LAKTYTFSRDVLVPYAATQVFQVIDDVAAYSQFLPNCASSGVQSRISENNGERVLGFMELGLMGVNSRLESNNFHLAPSRVEMNLLRGPFKELKGTWLIKSLGDAGCKVSFNMQWQYGKPMLEMLVGQRFEGIAQQLLDAFIAETARRAA
jgi:ribosome-associated toxin RatA of RatAB toxin-antitoxin module